MKSRSPSLARICDAAVQHFSVKGYDGGSLNEIASMVGIRKASLYSHFASKDALFLQVLLDAEEGERAFVAQTFDGADGVQDVPGACYVGAIAERYKTSVHLRFLLRAAFLPPADLKHEIADAYLGFLECLRSGFLRQLPDDLSQRESKSLGHAYVGIVESLYVEMTYADVEHMKVRRDALWQLFQDSYALRRSILECSDISLN